MNYNNIFEIDIWSSFGCFSKPFSTSGGILSYLIPPKTSIIGIIGAILGYRFDKYENENGVKVYDIEKLNSIKISIQPLFDLKTKRVTFNKVSGTGIMNIHQDVLIKPYYKLFISFPHSLINEENLFFDRISKNETIFNLYMGRNEFPLNFQLVRTFDFESFILNDKNYSDFFNKGAKVYGSLNSKNIKSTELSSRNEDTPNINIDENSIEVIFENTGDFKLINSFFEYTINNYPIKRKHFNEFEYSKISFYSILNFDDCYFSSLEPKENSSIELSKIGDNKWISLL